ncbi:MotE family protein [Kurthia sibirica]|uniref:Magnesium transporter MgtE intracellular domain-containing protein n=1 Tax=Kurthia sibirica TaxID=202750 RepID=A0A2U3AQR5_9BACL|nr:MotE family protein [Kurthia sibirica]PWI26898.1 hypothetical protein DEX24_00950 [Kurthia sibirica]GEK32561.1 hypothetical protein KSI01_00940 [Kurthia sibirica]
MAKKPAPTKRPNNKNRSIVTAEETQQTKSPGKLQKLFFWVIIPVLFTLAIGLIVAEVTGTNVFEKAKSVIGAGDSTQKETSDEAVENYNKQIVSLKASIKEKDTIVAKLQGQLDSTKTDTSKAEIEKKRLEAEIKKLQNSKADTKTDIATVIKTYEQMAPKKSAPILSAMSDKEAMKILKGLKPVTLATILEKMTPEKAAKYTEQLSKNK